MRSLIIGSLTSVQNTALSSFDGLSFKILRWKPDTVILIVSPQQKSCHIHKELPLKMYLGSLKKIYRKYLLLWLILRLYHIEF